MKRRLSLLYAFFRQEHGTAAITMLYLIVCIGGFLSLLLFVGQAGMIQMKSQQTADLITKGAREAGKWVYVDPDTGEVKKRLFATKREAQEQNADIVRGAREEAEILYEYNEPGLRKYAEEVIVEHQKGEKKYLYRQGIYHLKVEMESKLHLFWESVKLYLVRVSQSEVT